jgi:hypothetical protein
MTFQPKQFLAADGVVYQRDPVLESRDHPAPVWREGEVPKIPFHSVKGAQPGAVGGIISKRRLRELGFTPATRKFLPGAPDLAVEIVSASNTRTEIDDRLKDFFSSGTQLAWVVHPVDQFVEICHSPTQRQILGAGAQLEGENLLPGFSYPIADLFKEWDWE